MNVGNKILPVFCVIINLFLTSIIFSSWSTAKNNVISLIGTSAVPLMYVSFIIFCLFFYLGIPLIIFYSDKEFIDTIFKLFDSIITGFVFVLCILIAPLVLTILLNVIESVVNISGTNPVAIVLTWIFIIVITIGIPIFSFFIMPTQRIKNKIQNGSWEI